MGLADGAGVGVAAAEAPGDAAAEGSGLPLTTFGDAAGAGVTEALVQPARTAIVTSAVVMVLNM